MAYLDTFELISDKKKPYITVRERSITFSKTAIELLKYTPYVHMYIDKKGKKVAFQATEYDENTIAFYNEPKEGRPVYVRISDKNKAKLLLDLAGEKGTEKGIRFYGEYIADENVIGFDLSKPVKKD
ncbi:MAG: hypothetical protein Q4E54_05720 [Lachnospiraceae bacterium]|nr:hypothetical protein [Lachnospiraceae bacterium]